MGAGKRERGCAAPGTRFCHHSFYFISFLDDFSIKCTARTWSLKLRNSSDMAKAHEIYMAHGEVRSHRADERLPCKSGIFIHIEGIIEAIRNDSLNQSIRKNIFFRTAVSESTFQFQCLRSNLIDLHGFRPNRVRARAGKKSTAGKKMTPISLVFEPRASM